MGMYNTLLKNAQTELQVATCKFNYAVTDAEIDNAVLALLRAECKINVLYKYIKKLKGWGKSEKAV